MAVVDRALYKLHKMRSGAVGGGSRGAAGARRRPASQGRGHTLLQTTPDQASGSSSTAQAGTAGEVKAEQQEGPVEADDLDLGDTIAEMLSNGLGGCDLTVLLFVQVRQRVEVRNCEAAHMHVHKRQRMHSWGTRAVSQS